MTSFAMKRRSSRHRFQQSNSSKLVSKGGVVNRYSLFVVRYSLLVVWNTQNGERRADNGFRDSEPNYHLLAPNDQLRTSERDTSCR